MEARHLLLMIIDACGGKIESKTKLHKIAYFVSIKLNQNFQFTAYLYGPYSQMIEDGLNELTAVGFIDMSFCSYNESVNGFEKKKYSFEINDKGKELLNYLKNQNNEIYITIKENAEQLKEKNYNELSIAAKAHYILDKEKQPLNFHQISNKANEFHWKISKEDIDTAIEILRKLKLLNGS